MLCRVAWLGAAQHRCPAQRGCCPALPAQYWCLLSVVPHRLVVTLPTSHAACAAACDESAPVAKLGDNERTDRLLAAEQAVLEAGGCVVRLVGLYHAQR